MHRLGLGRRHVDAMVSLRRATPNNSTNSSIDCSSLSSIAWAILTNGSSLRCAAAAPKPIIHQPIPGKLSSNNLSILTSHGGWTFIIVIALPWALLLTYMNPCDDHSLGVNQRIGDQLANVPFSSIAIIRSTYNKNKRFMHLKTHHNKTCVSQLVNYEDALPDSPGKTLQPCLGETT